MKELIDSSMAHGRMLDDDHEPLQQFFVVLEHVLRHGLRRKYEPLQQFFVVPEHVFRHGLRRKYEPLQQFFVVLEHVFNHGLSCKCFSNPLPTIVSSADYPLQTVWSQIRSDIMSDLIWIQTV